MAEQVKTGYQRLFEVRALHHRYLYKDVPDFTGITTENDHNKRLLSGYDVRRFLSFAPTPSTRQRLKALGCVVKNTALGFIVAAPDIRKLLGGAVFEFYMTVQHADFVSNASFAGNKRRIVEMQHGGKLYRYKENAFLLTNSNGTARPAGGKTWLCLSGEIPAFNANASYPPDALTTDGTNLQQYLPNATWHQVSSAKSALPVFIHQGDIPVLTPPVGPDIQGIALEEGMPNDVFALIRIETLSPGNNFSLLDSTNNPQDPELRKPVFEIHFLPAPQP